jgi:hypothetical protein
MPSISRRDIYATVSAIHARSKVLTTILDQLPLRLKLELRDTLELTCDILETHDETIPENSEKLDDKFKKVLAKRWEEIKGTYLSYTATPNSQATQLACLLADYLAQADEKVAPIDFLMPTIAHHKNLVSRDDLRKEPLEKIIHLNILSDDNESLIPVDQYTYLELDSDLAAVHINPYLDKPLSEKEKNRLVKHSALTANIMGAFEKFHAALATSTTLYNALTRLKDGLREGGIRGVNGGTSQEASVIAYQSLEEFRTFWNLLSPKNRHKALEAPYFRRVLMSKICNPAWTDDCVDNFSYFLDFIIEKEKNQLIAIDLSVQSKKLMLQEIENSFNASKNALQRVLNTSENIALHYQGRDKLFLSIEQINQRPGEELIVADEEDVLLIVKDLQAEELAVICNSIAYKGQFRRFLRYIHPLFMVLLNLDIKQVEIFARAIVTENVPSARFNFGTYINLLSDAAAKAFFKGAKDNLLKNADFGVGFSQMNSAKLQIFLESVTIGNYDLGVLADFCIKANASVIVAVNEALPVSQASQFMYNLNDRISSLPWNDRIWYKIVSSAHQRQESLIVDMLLEITRYQTKLRKEIHPLLCYNQNKNSFINNPQIVEEFVNTNLFSLVRPDRTYLLQQYKYTLQLQAALKNSSPESAMRAAREIFRNPEVRYELEKTHGFWQWIFGTLGFSKGKQLLRFFDKKTAHVAVNSVPDQPHLPQVGIEPAVVRAVSLRV